MVNSKTQRAAGIILINACKNGFSDIHIEPKEENYKIRVRKDGVMQKFMSMSKKPGVQLVACLKNMAMMDIAEGTPKIHPSCTPEFQGHAFHNLRNRRASGQ